LSGDGARSGHRSLAVVGVAAVALALATWALALRDAGRLDGPLDVTGLQLAIAFFACEVFALRVERTYGESYGFNVALVPLAVGLVYAVPTELVLARLAGVALALPLVRIRHPLEAAYELAIHSAQTVVAVVVFRFVLGEADPVGVQGAFALLAGLAASFLLAAGALAAVVGLAMRRWPGRRAVGVIARTGAVAAILNAAIARLLVMPNVMWSTPAQARDHLSLFGDAVAHARREAESLYAPVVRKVRYGGL